ESNYRNNRPIKNDSFKGMIPYSLESIKLKKSGMKTFKLNEKRCASYDIVNVKFDTSVKSGNDILQDVPKWIKNKEESITKVKGYLEKAKKVKQRENLEEKLEQLEIELESLNKLKLELETNKEENNPVWENKCLDDLRHDLYTNGFDLDVYDKKEKGYVKTHFVLYTRSTAKSRTGQVWFIREDLHKEMSEWSNMRLNFDKDNVDLAGLMAYESLVSSAIVDKIVIDPDSILIIDKVTSSFNDKKVNVIGLKDGMLNCIPKNHPIENELFDGSALLDSSCFVRDFANKGFIQLRESFFKCAAFNVDLQGFYKEYFKEDYETATVEDMFGKPIKVSEIKMVINPSDLKLLKYSYAVGTKEDMWNYWKEFIKNENNSEFGVCGWENVTKRIDKDDIEEGKIYQQLSYQMVNSLPTNYKQISELVKFEVNYIDGIKNIPDKFMQYLDRTKNNMNANQMFMDIYEFDKDIVETQIYRNFKKETIRKYREHLQSGKIRVSGDYCVLGGNLVEYLLASVGEVQGELKESLVFKENEIFTPFLPPGEVVGFRNPHVSPANLLSVTNIRPDLETEHENPNHKYFKYFKVTDNIAIVNGCNGSLLNDTLNGCDFDGDTCLFSNSSILLDIVNEAKGEFLVPVNDIPLKEENDDLNFRLENKSKAKVDNKLSLSQKRIGAISNLGQQACSIMWNEVHKKNPNQKKIKELLEIVNSLAVCSGLAIDGAKREYKLDLDEQIKHFRKVLNRMLIVHQGEEVNKLTGELKKKDYKVFPKFWKFVKEEKKNKDSVEEVVISETVTSKMQREGIYYNTPMDWLIYVLDKKITRGTGVKNPKRLIELLVDGRIKDGDRRKQANIEQLAFESQQGTSRFYAIGFNNEDEEEEMLREVEVIMEKYDRKVSKVKMDEKTMYALLAKISKRTEGEEENIRPDGEPYANLRIMLHLYKTYKELFLQAFKNISKNAHH
ncbi:hypothetical protein V7149_23090, partial [Bacillus sp. JJ1503]|uniref:hypothetical protein n=1 Tax=Bacillus sp. JJ1503 TaxID=3122956 RepID=UPI002FFFF46E